jgi:hypothetical protein
MRADGLVMTGEYIFHADRFVDLVLAKGAMGIHHPMRLNDNCENGKPSEMVASHDLNPFPVMLNPPSPNKNTSGIF